MANNNSITEIDDTIFCNSTKKYYCIEEVSHLQLEEHLKQDKPVHTNGLNELACETQFLLKGPCAKYYEKPPFRHSYNNSRPIISWQTDHWPSVDYVQRVNGNDDYIKHIKPTNNGTIQHIRLKIVSSSHESSSLDESEESHHDSSDLPLNLSDLFSQQPIYNVAIITDEQDEFYATVPIYTSARYSSSLSDQEGQVLGEWLGKWEKHYYTKYLDKTIKFRSKKLLTKEKHSLQVEIITQTSALSSSSSSSDSQRKTKKKKRKKISPRHINCDKSANSQESQTNVKVDQAPGSGSVDSKVSPTKNFKHFHEFTLKMRSQFHNIPDICVIITLEESQKEYYCNNMNKAMQLCLEAIDKSKSCENNLMLLTRALYVMSGICRKMKNYPAALNYATQSQEVAAFIKRGEDTAEATYNVARLSGEVININEPMYAGIKPQDKMGAVRALLEVLK